MVNAKPRANNSEFDQRLNARSEDRLRLDSLSTGFGVRHNRAQLNEP